MTSSNALPNTIPLITDNGFHDETFTIKSNVDAVMKLEQEDEDRDGLSEEERRKWVTAAVGLAYLSVFCFIILGAFSFYVSDLANSAAAFGFGFDCFLDVGTSIVVIWRFYGNGSSSSSSYSLKKELIALFILGILFIMASLSVAIKAIKYLVEGTLLEESWWLYGLAGGATLICTVLFSSKFYVAHKLKSKSVKADGYSSLACGITAFTIIVSAAIVSADENIYYLDNVVGIILAVFLFCYGIKLLVDVCNTPKDKSQKISLQVFNQPGYSTMK